MAISLSRRKMSRFLSAAIPVALFVLLIANGCRPDPNSFSDFRNIETPGWLYSQRITFTPQHSDSIMETDMFLTLRHTNQYPYSNIWIEVVSGDIEKGTVTDTVNIQLADIYGNWLGKGSGVLYQLETPIKLGMQHISLSPVTIRHIMKTDTLPGIDLLGLTASKTKTKR